MGSGLIEAEAAGCTGDDVLKELKDAFGDPNSQAFAFAQANNTFGQIGGAAGNAQALINAYTNAGVPVCQGWQYYLGTLDPADILAIAQARNTGLTGGNRMITKTHTPPKGGHGHVHTSTGNDGTITIDSPYSAAIVYKNQNRNSKP